MNRMRIGAMLLLAACGQGVKDEARAVPDSANVQQTALTVGPYTDSCQDPVEVRALECSKGSVIRKGETLFVALTSRPPTSFVNGGGEAPHGFQYVGRFGGGRFDVIESNGGETYPTAIFVERQTGRTVRTGRDFVFAPDGQHFATADADWHNCAELDQPHLEVWRLSDSIPVREWSLVSFSCRAQTGWGATNPRWIAPDTLEFRRRVLASDSLAGAVERTTRAVRSAAGWRVDSL